MRELITYSKVAEGCPVEYALKVIEGKWKLPILFVLSQNGTLRYNELKKSIEGITNMMLTRSLKELEKDGMIERLQFNEIPPHVDYSLAEAAKVLLSILEELKKWGIDHS